MSLNDCTPTGKSVCFATLANSQRMVCISDDFNLHQLIFHFRKSSKTHIAHPCFFFSSFFFIVSICKRIKQILTRIQKKPKCLRHKN